jgi:hypothetical protein
LTVEAFSVISQVACSIVGFPPAIGCSPRYFLRATAADDLAKSLILLVPGKGIEPLTFGLQIIGCGRL